MIDAGNYTVTAKFSGDIKNYEPIADMTTIIKIKKATYDISSISLSNKTVEYLHCLIKK